MYKKEGVKIKNIRLINIFIKIRNFIKHDKSLYT